MTDYRIRVGGEVREPAPRQSERVQDPLERSRHLRRPRLPRPRGMRPADPADRRQSRPLAIALGHDRPRIPHQRKLQPRSRRADRRGRRGEDHRADRHRSGQWRDHPGPALRGRPAVQAAPRFLPPGRALLAGNGAVRRPAHLDRDDLPQRARGRRPDLVRAGRRQGRAARPGNLLAWNNLDAIGEPNFHSIHQGMPVAAGVKYIITKWHRERPWLPSDMPTY